MNTDEETTKSPDVFDEIEEQIRQNNPREIRLQPLQKNRKDQTLQEFLTKFFLVWNNEKNTIYADTKDIQTDTRRRRSLGDIFLICKYYYPTTTLREVLNLLYDVLPSIMPAGFRSSYCSTIDKRVWYFDEDRRGALINEDHRDEFGKIVNFYLDNLNSSTGEDS